MSDVVQDPVVVDVPTSGGIEFPADMVSTTSDAPAAAVVEKAVEKAAEPKSEDKSADEKPEFKKPAWVRWTDEGGMRIEPGHGASIDANGNIVLDPEVAQRMATKRVMRVRDEERARADRLLREERAKFERERPAPKVDSDKPWTAKGAEKPQLADFDDVEQYMDARDEWRDAQNRKDTPVEKADGPNLDDEGLPTRDSFESDEEWQEAVDEKKFALKHGTLIAAMMNEGKTLYEDYDEVAGPVVLSRDALEAVLESDNAAEILYHLGSHPESIEKLQGLEGSRLHKAIGRIEDALHTPQGTVVPNAPTATAQAPSLQPVPVTKPTRGAAPPRSNPVDLAAQQDADGFFSHLKSLGL